MKKRRRDQKNIEPGKNFFWPFEAKDGWVGLVAALISLVVYVYTAAPNVTLLDSGELLTAAIHFGVPHPTGYPLWTLGGWLFSLLPLGNAAWEVNVFSGFCGAWAVGLTALLLSNTITWILSDDSQPQDDRLFQMSVWVSWAFGLAFALSVPMWTQCVIAEVYSLHALLVMLFVCALYRWIRQPEANMPFVIMMFFYALAWSNHHLILSLTPVPLILLVLLRQNQVWEFILYLMLVGALGYLGFAFLADDPLTPHMDDPATLHAAIRFLLCILVTLGIFFWYQRKLPHWKYGALLILVMGLGFLPYGYMPLASSTNPPMNWGYAKEKAGFFWSINRSQYQGSLSVQLINTVGKFTGAAPEIPKAFSQKKPRLESLRMFAATYWSKIVESYNFAGLACFAFAFLLILRVNFWRRAWILTMFMLFILAAFFEPFFNQPWLDNQGWMLQMPYHAYSFEMFALVAGLGAAGATWFILKKWNLSGRWAMLWLALPLAMGVQNAALCSQRGHWFGWEFGHGILKDLPKGSIFLGGTDPGRFVQTYMIFGESPQPAALKRDPDFDRRDLYIITQNTLLDPFYLKYLWDQYTEKRPPIKNVFERWLGRDTMYPAEPILLPTREEIDQIMDETFQKLHAQSNVPMGQETIAANSAVAEWIFQKNKDKHPFYVEESFKMEWSYPYAVPHGLCYQLQAEPLENLPQDIVDRDMQFWGNYTQKLLNDPHFKEDADAQRSFCKLRNTTGNIYHFRGMLKEAEIAWKQALALYPCDGQTVESLMALWLKQKRYDEIAFICERAYALDPLNEGLLMLTANALRYQEESRKAQKLKEQWTQNPGNKQIILDLIQCYVVLQDFDQKEELSTMAFPLFSKDEELYRELIHYCVAGKKYDDALKLTDALIALKPQDAQNKFISAKIFFMAEKKDEFYKTAQSAIQQGGVSMRERFALDASFLPIRADPEFQALLGPINSTKSPINRK
ncbi:MAG: protein O-mannosyl-transferase family [Verrucomicrobiota bacterium]